MAYLDSDAAAPIYIKKADIVKLHGLTGIVDIGCRIGTVNQYLSGYDYNYYGFDTSIEPIDYAKTKYKNKIFEVRSWHDPVKPPFAVDVLIFGSVIIYEPNPIEFYEKMVDFYQPTRCIVHEVNNKNSDELKYTDLAYFTNNYQCNVHEMDLPIPCGKRTVLDVECRQL